MKRLASKEIFLPSNKINREVGRAKDLSAPRYRDTYIPRKTLVLLFLIDKSTTAIEKSD
jgi:hypothetical protein